MKSSAKKVELAPYDDLFSTEESRQDAKLEKIREIPLSELHPFKNHPFKVKDDEAMMETADSVRQYTAPLLPSDLKGDTAEQLFYRFNNEHPADYRHPSMSVSDIVAIKRDGKVSCHYCDSFGFEQVPGFLPDNPLKNAEMVVEDDYGMIDGIINNGPKEPTVAQLEQQARSSQPISLMDLAAAAHREDREKKKSVMEQLKSQPKAEHKRTAPKKSAEREI